jgi:hypothetical protein
MSLGESWFFFFSVLSSTDPEMQEYLDYFNWFFSVVMNFSLLAMLVGWICRAVSRS